MDPLPAGRHGEPLVGYSTAEPFCQQFGITSPLAPLHPSGDAVTDGEQISDPKQCQIPQKNLQSQVLKLQVIGADGTFTKMLLEKIIVSLPCFQTP